MRFKTTGHTKHEGWQRMWEAQRSEDAGQPSPEPLPQKYKSTDYASPDYWRLRGKLDVPKERFISYPGCESDEDGEPVYGWAGWDHLLRSQALATLYQHRKTEEGWPKDRLIPILAGLYELLAWLKQWHNAEPDPTYGVLMGDYYEQFLEGERNTLGLPLDEITGWSPARTTRAPRKKRVAVPRVALTARDFATLPDFAWKTPSGVSDATIALFSLVEVLHTIGRAVDTDHVRLAALLVRKPALALPFMDASTKREWTRLVGAEARPLPNNVIPLSDFRKNKSDHAWSEAVKQLKASGGLVEADSAGTWAPGSQLPPSRQEWIKARAALAVRLLADLDVAGVEQKLVAFVEEVEHAAAG
jgi:hypothetical protein